MAKAKRSKGSSQWVGVAKSSIHQRGLFAKRNIPEGTRIIEYFGEKITKVESERRGIAQHERGRRGGDGTVYIFNLNSRYDIDGDVLGNDARFINHSCDPNTHIEIHDHSIWVIASVNIAKGEEITYDYNFGPSYYEDNPCHCGAKNCVGYIVGSEYWDELRKMIRARKKREKARRGRRGNKKEKAKGK